MTSEVRHNGMVIHRGIETPRSARSDGAGGASQPSHFQVEDANVRSVVRSNDAHVLRDPRLVKLASHAAAEIVNSIRRAKKVGVGTMVPGSRAQAVVTTANSGVREAACCAGHLG